ncbi:methyltransferase domain-containing protein [Kitasatospora sp. NBC_01287]|uniref:methyltransferase domain-containing protein n=1 Tax=Kitasatospora sp. NBC_01287 TaxID=2903573 RepID=UPI002253D374|nr:methyltransferase domain-containing protein [Kitasatospora sp. NBC_01287]MCX4750947.1 methyltransferase domain-containing protein [Kitasatospora sp. NBC_01287]MCX4751802.1 methyltransferase domain-containing protein [Kitasatospora sp. NBC_01287]MCX4751906.1 methyltransferase domain-containing protein [Kitasatospora sp. NBC_01287]
MTATDQDRPGTTGRSFPVSGPWAAAMDALPRALFLPDLMWAHDMFTGASEPVDRRADPDAWGEAAAADIPLVTQWDDGRNSDAQAGTVPTSSASMPSIVAGMLEDLDASPGMRVLEIGTGTGWNAGLLAHRLGDNAVTTIEVDPAVAEAAREHLAAAGLHPTVITGDGSAGHPAGAPYDRIIATCGMRHIPHAWIEQLQPGGVILAPWGTHFENGDALVRLTAAQDGTLAGPFLRPVEFMKMRSQRLTPPQHPVDFPGDASVSTTAARPPFGPWKAFPFVAGLRLAGLTHVTDRRGDERVVWLYGLADKSWAAVVFQDEVERSTVWQSGPRRLWDEMEAAHDWWQAAGRPGIDRFGLTVDRDGQHPWLNSPDNRVEP